MGISFCVYEWAEAFLTYPSDSWKDMSQTPHLVFQCQKTLEEFALPSWIARFRNPVIEHLLTISARELFLVRVNAGQGPEILGALKGHPRWGKYFPQHLPALNERRRSRNLPPIDLEFDLIWRFIHEHGPARIGSFHEGAILLSQSKLHRAMEVLTTMILHSD